ncbi:MAG: hypothetical protein IAE77_16215 [Prosthecobacter sp.]|uniref:hypothetical protein n=1 Tax=Prosthecobacter sp. TaxID=1965333 RepID=UPI0019D97D06|nr:hypothetical protein [Prosthecobacter sp.]MBE2285007.1 hypothetical protein [Prosthecobacter sp.]
MKRRAQTKPKKPIWQPEHWLMWWQIFLSRLPWIIIALAMAGNSYGIRDWFSIFRCLPIR